MTAPTTFSAQWARAAELFADRIFLRFEASDGTISEWTYGGFDDAVIDVAERLLEAGVRTGRGVHLALTNSPSFVAVWIAACRLGAFIVPSDPMATAPELAEHLVRTDPAVSIVSTERRSIADAAVASLESELTCHEIIAVDEDDAAMLPVSSCTGHEVVWPAPEPTDRAAIMFTSGTTGRPKGVEITQANYAFAGETMATAARLTADSRQLVVLPLFHANAQYYSFASAIAVGASVALMHTFSASGFLAQAARHRATHASLFAGPMRMILARGSRWTPRDDEEPLVLEHCWYAQNITGEQYATISDWFGCEPRQLYGMTETIPAVLTDTPIGPRHDSMGYPTEGCSVAIHDADGRPVAPGEVGEIVVGGEPGTTLFAGYLDDPETTAASFRDGWFLTGDRARADASGRYFFDGRRSDVLKVAGENVSVVEVEAVVGAHPDVFDVVVVGAPDPIRDEVPVAFVVTVPGVDADGLPDQLTEWCAERLGKSKRPRSYTCVDELPRTSVGKVRKFLLAEAAATPDQSIDNSTTNTTSTTSTATTQPPREETSP